MLQIHNSNRKQRRKGAVESAVSLFTTPELARIIKYVLSMCCIDIKLIPLLCVEIFSFVGCVRGCTDQRTWVTRGLVKYVIECSHLRVLSDHSLFSKSSSTN